MAELGSEPESSGLEALAWRPFLERYFPHYVTAPFAERHVRFWEWISALRPGRKPRHRIEVWGRGGGKSSTIELGAAYLGGQPRPVRHFVLYVSETQEQANRHVQAVAGMLERVGVPRAVNQYGHSKSWTQTTIRAANGFNMMAFGLDAGMRGIRLEEFRPDLIVMDDIDGRHDTEATVEKKIDILTETVLPAGSVDCAVIIVQNKIHKDSIVSQLCDGRAEFLLDRDPPAIEPAVIGLEYELETRPDGTHRYHITDGTATWAGQDLDTCEQQLNEWGPVAFEREAQHRVDVVGNPPFRREMFRDVLPGEHYTSIIQAWDTAFKTNPKNDASCCLTIAVSLTGFDILDMWHGRVEFPDLERAAIDQATWAMHRWRGMPFTVLIEDKASGQSLLQNLARHTKLPIVPVPASRKDEKDQRVQEITPTATARRIGVPVAAPWREQFLREVCGYPDEKHDDIVDSLTIGIRHGAGIDVRAQPAKTSSYMRAEDRRTRRRLRTAKGARDDR